MSRTLVIGLTAFVVIFAAMVALGLFMRWEEDASLHRGIPVELEAEDD